MELNENLPLMDQASLLTELYHLFRNRNVMMGSKNSEAKTDISPLC